MNKFKIISMILTLSFLIACGDSSKSKDSKEVKSSPKTTNPLDGYVKVIDKAKATEQKVLDAAEKQRKAIEAMEQGQKASDDDN